MERADVAVIGGGPAGSVLASLLLRKDPGRRVVIIERTPHPRHHVGESLIPGIAPIFARAGVLEALEACAEAGDDNEAGILRKVGVVYHWGDTAGSSWTADFREPGTERPAIGSYQVDRAKLDAFLLRHAARLGAQVREGWTALDAAPVEGGGFELALQKPDGTAERLAARFLVDASGLARFLCRAWGIERRGFDRMNNFAVFGYWRGSKRHQHGAPLAGNETWTFISTAEDGWCWHIPIAGGLTSVGLVTSREALTRHKDDLEGFYRKNIASCVGTPDLLASAVLDKHPAAASQLVTVRDWSSHAAEVAGDGWFMIGDAGIFVDPILTSGVVLAMLSSSMAANAIETLLGDPAVDPALLRESYAESYLDLGRGYHRLAEVWYARNDKVRSWWWEARRATIRGGQSPARGLDMGSFLAWSLGLARDPFAGRALERGESVDLVRPDKLLMMRNLFGEAKEVDEDLVRLLGKLRETSGGEIGAREQLYARMMRRFRTLLSSRVRLEGVRARLRDRYYTDRTLDVWRRAQLFELTRDDDAGFAERMVFAGDTDVDAPLGVPIAADQTLGAALRQGTAGLRTGSWDYRKKVQRVWEHAMQLDMLGWLAVDAARPQAELDRAFDEAAAALVQLLDAIRGERPVAFIVDPAARYLELVFLGEEVARLQLVPLGHAGDARGGRRTATVCGFTVMGADDARAAEIHGAVLGRLAELERSARPPWDALLEPAAGYCASREGSETRPRMPELLPSR